MHPPPWSPVCADDKPDLPNPQAQRKAQQPPAQCEVEVTSHLLSTVLTFTKRPPARPPTTLRRAA